MQHSKFIQTFMQPFPHFDASDVGETGFINELYILDQCELSSLGLYSDKLLAHPSEKPTEKFSALLCTNFTRF